MVLRKVEKERTVRTCAFCMIYKLNVFFYTAGTEMENLEEPQFGHEVYDFTQKIPKCLPSHQDISTKVKEEI